MGNLKQRIERLEGNRKGMPIIIVGPGETVEEALQKHLAQHPEDKGAGPRIILRLNGPAPEA